MENTKILYGIMAFRNNLKKVKTNIFDKLKLENNDKVLITLNTDNLNNIEEEDKWNHPTGILYRTAEKNISADRNQFIQYAKKEKYNYLVLFDDDIIVKNNSCVSEYISLMKKTNQDVMFFGFGHTLKNKVLQSKPNPAINIKIDKKGNYISATREPVSGMIVIKIDDSTLEFDEKLFTLEKEYYLWDNYKSKKILEFGFFIEPYESWKWLSRDTEILSTKKPPTQADFFADFSMRGTEKYKYATNVDNFLNTLKLYYNIKSKDIKETKDNINLQQWSI